MKRRLWDLLSSRAWLPAVVAITTLARLALVAAIGGRTAFSDERDYHAIAVALLDGRGFVDPAGLHAFRPPGQPFFLAAVYAAFGARPLVAEIVQCLALAAVPFLVERIARAIGAGRAPARLAATIAAAHPALAYAATTLYPTIWTTVALTAGLLAAARAVERRSARAGAAAGALLGVAGAFTTYFAVLPLACAAVAWKRRARGVAVAVALVGMLPAAVWAARDLAVIGSASLSTNVGYNMALGANDRASARSGNHVEADVTPTGDEVARDAAYRAAAIGWIRRHPARWLELAALRAVALADSVGRPKTRGPHDGALARLAGWALLPLPIFGLVGIVLSRRRPAAWMLAAALAVVAASAASSISKPRFRFPCDPALAAFAVRIVRRKRAA